MQTPSCETITGLRKRRKIQGSQDYLRKPSCIVEDVRQALGTIFNRFATINFVYIKFCIVLIVPGKHN